VVYTRVYLRVYLGRTGICTRVYLRKKERTLRKDPSVLPEEREDPLRGEPPFLLRLLKTGLYPRVGSLLFRVYSRFTVGPY